MPTKRSLKPRLSVLIPAYNAEDTLEDALRDALGQKTDDTEIIVCDDGSNDGTGEILKRYEGDVRVIRNSRNLGVGRSRQKLIEAASGGYVFFLDADDRLPKGYLETMLKRADGADVVFSSYRKDGRLYSVPSGVLSRKKV